MINVDKIDYRTSQNKKIVHEMEEATNFQKSVTSYIDDPLAEFPNHIILLAYLSEFSFA